MTRLLEKIPLAGTLVYMVVGRFYRGDDGIMRLTTLLISTAGILAVLRLGRRNGASPIHKGLVGFMIVASLAVWLWPEGAGRLVAEYPATALYAVLFLVAVAPPLIGREVFTMYFARKSAPATVWKTDIFLKINYHLTAFWSALFLGSMLSGLVPGVFELHGRIYRFTFEGFLPAALMLALGAPVTKWYPDYYQRKMGLIPIGHRTPGDALSVAAEQHHQRQLTVPFVKPAREEKEDRKMSDKSTIVAVNGSPHSGIGNTAMMIEMLRRPLAEDGFDLEVVDLNDHEIEYCKGCGFCLEKGECWIADDHRQIVKRLLRADGVILGSPVYFLHVTAQMKTFLDRSLAFGHKPRSTWKPGLAVSVSAGLGETATADYLASLLRVFGAFAVGTLTAMATGPGQFIGREFVEARAHDLAGDLARAINENRRYPATDKDLRYYQFMGDLVKNHKDTVMKDDYRHWQELGFYESFENYIQQTRAKVPYDEKMREAWIQNLIARQQAEKKTRSAAVKKRQSEIGSPPAKNCAELLQVMPQGFSPSEANGLEAIYQFEVSGAEVFVAYLKIANGVCSYHDGPAENPNVTIKTPADVWLSIANGELDGQQAFMKGYYQVEGEMSLLLRLKDLFTR